MMGGDPVLITLSKTTKIAELKKMIREKMEVGGQQTLYYRGKPLDDENTVFDYDVKLNDIIQMMVRPPLADSQADNLPNIKQKTAEKKEEKLNEEETDSETKNDEKDENLVEDVESEWWQPGDLVDICDVEDGSDTAGGWFEGKIVRVTRETGPQAIVAGEDHLTYLVSYDAFAGDDYKVALENLRPRARKVLKARELAAGQEVLVSYNVQQPEQRGPWLAATVEKVRPLTCTVRLGVDQAVVPDCRITFDTEVMRLEERVRLADRTEKLEREMAIPVARKHPEKCSYCHDKESRKCKECGCRKCGGKDDEDQLIICDECQDYFHAIKCLGLQAIPDEDEWYCPGCKNEEEAVTGKVKAGKKKAKMASKANENQKRDWGQGMATVGRTKECTKVTKTHFGPIPGVEVGMNWKFRLQVSEEGVHRPHVAGIAGTAENGCPSLVLSGGYEDDVDEGDVFTYTGSGGRDLSGNKRTAEQSSDQELTRTNAALAVNCACKFDAKNGGDAGENWRDGKPIRVVRGWKGAKHSKFAPADGCRYDGIYKVMKYWPQKGKKGFIVWRYRLKRDDESPAPWTKEGKKRIEEGGYSELIVPEGHWEAEAEKLKKKEATLKEKEAAKQALKAEKNAAKEDKKGEKGDNQKVAKKVTKRKHSGGSDADASSILPRSPPAKKGKTVVGAPGKPATVYKFKISSTMQQVFDADKQNKKVWEDVKTQEYGTKKDLNDFIEEKFGCIVCQDVVFMPITTPCGHNFCKDCLKRSFKAGCFSCPACRNDLDKDLVDSVNDKLRKALQLVFPAYETSRA